MTTRWNLASHGCRPLNCGHFPEGPTDLKPSLLLSRNEVISTLFASLKQWAVLYLLTLLPSVLTAKSFCFMQVPSLLSWDVALFNASWVQKVLSWYTGYCWSGALIHSTHNADLHVINSSPPNAAYIRQWMGQSLVQIMACRLFGLKPLSEPVNWTFGDKPQLHFWLNKNILFKKMHLKYRLRNGGWGKPLVVYSF